MNDTNIAMPILSSYRIPTRKRAISSGRHDIQAYDSFQPTIGIPANKLTKNKSIATDSIRRLLKSRVDQLASPSV